MCTFLCKCFCTLVIDSFRYSMHTCTYLDVHISTAHTLVHRSSVLLHEHAWLHQHDGDFSLQVALFPDAPRLNKSSLGSRWRCRAHPIPSCKPGPGLRFHHARGQGRGRRRGQRPGWFGSAFQKTRRIVHFRGEQTIFTAHIGPGIARARFALAPQSR